MSTLRSRFVVLGVLGRCGRCSRPGAGRFVPNTSSANGGSLRWSRARRSAPATRCWRRRSWRSGKVSRRAPPASRARSCPIGPARRGNSATAATGAGVPACVGGASTNRPRPSSPAAFRGRSGCRGAAADTPPPASAQSPRRGVGRGQGTRSSREVKLPSHREPTPLATVRRNPQRDCPPRGSFLLPWGWTACGERHWAACFGVSSFLPALFSATSRSLSRCVIRSRPFYLVHLGHYHLAATASISPLLKPDKPASMTIVL